MSIRFAARAMEVVPFQAMEIMERAFALEREGRDVLHLEIGEPRFDPPEAALAACARALRDGETGYTDSRGLPDLREAIAGEHARRSGRAVSPEQVLVTSGTSAAMLLVFGLLVAPGDEVVIGSPHYPCYPNFVRFCGGRPVFVPTRAEDDYRLEPDAVRSAVSDRTRAIVVGSPANPTGAIQEAETLRALAELGIPLVADEIYAGLHYDDAAPGSALATAEHVFVLDGFSKRYAMTGFRLGYVIAPRLAMRQLQVLQQNLFISANRFVQHAGTAAIRHGEPMVAAMRDALDGRRRRLVAGLRRLGLDVPVTPRGAFYVFADARSVDHDSRRLAHELLERSGVAVTPGIDFGDVGEGWLRFSYATDDAVIEEALARLADTLPSLR